MKSLVLILLTFVLGSFGSTPSLALLAEGAKKITFTHSHPHDYSHHDANDYTHSENHHEADSHETHTHTILVTLYLSLYIDSKNCIGFDFEVCGFYPESLTNTFSLFSFTGSIFRPPISV